MNEHQTEVDRNFEAFQALMPKIGREHAGQYALLRESAIIEYFDTAPDALKYGARCYDDGRFSVQRVADETVDLGWYSHAVRQ